MRHNIKKGDAMNNEEQYILNRCGKQNPFTVPEGYSIVCAQSLCNASK